MKQSSPLKIWVIMMNDVDMLKKLSEYSALVDKKLESCFEVYDNNLLQIRAADAMKYSLMSGGKRLRPALVIEFAKMCMGSEDKALSAAIALEMVHTFSLIHDDLPCMDDDDMRRGNPSCHKKFDEATALLAGDALLNYAFEIIVSEKNISDSVKVKLISELTRATGISGMIGGQIIDMDNTHENNFDKEIILSMYSLKTSALIKCACKMGCICAENEEKIQSAERFGEYFGLAFQIKDDILDVTSTSEVLGKNVGSDEIQNKETYLKRVGMEKAVCELESYTQKALFELKAFDNADFLVSLTKWQCTREK